MLLAESGDVSTASGLEVVSHAVVEGEHAGGGSNLGTHVADGGHAYVVSMDANVSICHPQTRLARQKVKQHNGSDVTMSQRALVAMSQQKPYTGMLLQKPRGTPHTSGPAKCAGKWDQYAKEDTIYKGYHDVHI